MLHWSQVAHLDEIHIGQKAWHLSTSGCYDHLSCDERGKVVQPSVSGGPYWKLGTDTTLKCTKDVCFYLGVAIVYYETDEGEKVLKGKRAEPLIIQVSIW